MTFIVHFIVRSAIKNLHFDIVSHDPVSAETLPSLREACAGYANLKARCSDFAADDIVIANIIPIPK